MKATNNYFINSYSLLVFSVRALHPGADHPAEAAAGAAAPQLPPGRHPGRTCPGGQESRSPPGHGQSEQ